MTFLESTAVFVRSYQRARHPKYDVMAVAVAAIAAAAFPHDFATSKQIHTMSFRFPNTLLIEGMPPSDDINSSAIQLLKVTFLELTAVLYEAISGPEIINTM